MSNGHVSTSLDFKVKESCWIEYPIARFFIIEKWEKYLYRNNKKT